MLYLPEGNPSSCSGFEFGQLIRFSAHFESSASAYPILFGIVHVIIQLFIIMENEYFVTRYQNTIVRMCASSATGDILDRDSHLLFYFHSL